MVGRGHGQQFVLGHRGGVEAGGVVGQGDQGGVKGPGLQSLDQAMGEVLAQEQLQLGEALAQQGQGAGQQERGDGRDHAQAEAARQRLAGGAGGLHQILRARQDVVAPARHLLADGGEDHARTGPIDHRRVERALQFLNAGRQGGLGDVGGLCGAAE